MIKIENVSVTGWEDAIRGMRNPMNSWKKSDSYYEPSGYDAERGITQYRYILGPNDLSLTKRLRKSGVTHRKFMRMITVYLDVTAPLYWWKEYDTLKVGTVANSCSTMHKIQAKQFTRDDFSHEHLRTNAIGGLEYIIALLNKYRDAYLASKDKGDWWQMIQLLPSSYNQKRTLMLNYEVLANAYSSRRNHKLDEWREFCKWTESLPYSELITGGSDEEEA